MTERTILRLSDLTRKLQQTIDSVFGMAKFWIIADISSHTFKPDTNFHYFELVEKDTQSSRIVAKIAARAWGNAAIHIRNFELATGQVFKNDINVLIQVSVQFHETYGLQINLLDIDTKFTLGKFEQERNATLLKLVTDNPLFIQKQGNEFITKNKLLKLNRVIQRIAVITSETSAGYQDFNHTLVNNNYQYTFSLDLYFTKVQGEVNSKVLLSKLIEVFEAGIAYDAVVVIRGGGSQSDFLLFDNYELSRAVAKFPIPIITGIGHHKNETIVDLMAHTATKTPTKAAELIIANNRNFEESLQQLQQLVVIKTQQQFLVANKDMDLLKSVIVKESLTLLQRSQRHLSQISGIFINRPTMLLQQEKRTIENILRNIKIANQQMLKHKLMNLSHHQSLINLMSPKNILRKGFAILELDGKIISNADLVAPGKALVIRLIDSKITTMVTSKTQENGN
ncbi:exodeoxyribonuclease VII large subunit [Pedobacter sp. CAN_A7]|uniref:exodeoxyribonuclease VII large subunit n=1 Tax=Pedobacter sp. CAN_A7 TaxID=2787722 RepID=UPI001A2C6F0D